MATSLGNTSPGGEIGETEGGLSACDTCYQRKIKCDRKLPCGNCQDSKTSCLRLRQRQKRKPRENVSSKLKETKEQMEERMANLESTITGLMRKTGAAKNVQSSSGTAVDARDVNTPDTISSSVGSLQRPQIGKVQAINSDDAPTPQIWCSYKEPSYSTPPYSAVEAQHMIQQVLTQGTSLSKQKKEAFHAALGSLSSSLKTSRQDPGIPTLEGNDQHAKPEEMQPPMYPDIETVQWVLNPGKPNDCLWVMPDTLHVITRKRLSEMALDVQDPQRRKDNPAAVVCVCSLAAHFLLDHLMSTRDLKVLDAALRAKVAGYFATAQDALSQLSVLDTPSLDNLQALIFGAVNAQEAGHAIDAWKLIVAACNLCIAFNLHKEVCAFENAPEESLSQARYCFFLCYINDKGLAMNLGKPPCLPDAYIEIDLRNVPSPEDNAGRQMLQGYVLELALTQSKIIELQFTKKRMTSQEIHSKVNEILKNLDVVWDLLEKLPDEVLPTINVDEIEYEILMGKFALFSIKTVLFQSCIDNIHTSIYREPLLEAARSSMREIKKMNEGLKKFNEYRAHSFAHWTVLYYPFTTFFILFCNVISKKNPQDYELMLEFVNYLIGIKEHSLPVAKLHNLCLPFCALASTALKSVDETQSSTSKTRTSKRQKIGMHTEQREQESLQSSTPPTLREIAQMEQQLLPTQSFVPLGGDLNNNAAFDLNDDVLAQFMDFQPTLQWLDTDLSAFEQNWVNTGFVGVQDNIGYSNFDGSGIQ